MKDLIPCYKNLSKPPKRIQNRTTQQVHASSWKSLSLSEKYMNHYGDTYLAIQHAGYYKTMNAYLLQNQREKSLFAKSTGFTLISTIANAGQDMIIFDLISTKNVISAQSIRLLNLNNN